MSTTTTQQQPMGMMGAMDTNQMINMMMTSYTMNMMNTMRNPASASVWDTLISLMVMTFLPEVKKWVTEFIEWAKSHVLKNIPLWASATVQYCFISYQSIMVSLMFQKQTPIGDIICEIPDISDDCDSNNNEQQVMVELEMTQYSINALYQFLTMTPQQREKVADYSQELPVPTMTVYKTAKMAFDTVTANKATYTYDNIKIYMTPEITMQISSPLLITIDHIDNKLTNFEKPEPKTIEVDLDWWIKNEYVTSIGIPEIKQMVIMTIQALFNKYKYGELLYQLQSDEDHCESTYNAIYSYANRINKFASWLNVGTDYNNIPNMSELQTILLISHIENTCDINANNKYDDDIIKHGILFRIIQYTVRQYTNTSDFTCNYNKTNYCIYYHKLNIGIYKLIMLKGYPKTNSKLYALLMSEDKCVIYTRDFKCNKLFKAAIENTCITSKSAVAVHISTANDTLQSQTLYDQFREFYKNTIIKSAHSANNATKIDRINVYAIYFDKREETTVVPNPKYEAWANVFARYAPSPSSDASTSAAATDTTSTDKSTAIIGNYPMMADMMFRAYDTQPEKTIEIKKWQSTLVCKSINKTFKNIDSLYLREADKVQLTNVINNFKNSREMYDRLGIPYKLGMLFHGAPGTGKSSSIKAVASFLGRDIYFINLKNVRTNAELKQIFDYINDVCGGGVIVFEDIDAACDVVKRRMDSTSTTQAASMAQTVVEDEQTDQLTLSYILNLLDGAICKEGTIFAITTNHLDHLDPALYRTGRVDITIEFKLCDHYQIRDIYRSIIRRELSATVLRQIEEYRWTPADIIFGIYHYMINNTCDDATIMAKFISNTHDKVLSPAAAGPTHNIEKPAVQQYFIDIQTTIGKTIP